MNQKLDKLVIFGTGKMAEMAYKYMMKDKAFDVVAFTVDKKMMKEETFLGLPVVAFEDVEKEYPPDSFKMFIGIGYKFMNKVRTEKYHDAKKKGYTMATYIASGSQIWDDLEIGENCFILENQVIQPNVKIGNNVFLWSGNHLGHDVVIEDNVWISSHVVLSGNVYVGERTFIGINSTIRDNVKIGKNCLIGAGSIILKDTKDNEVYMEEQTKRYPLTTDKFIKLFEISRR